MGLECFRVQKILAVNHLPLEHRGVAVQTWTSNDAFERKVNFLIMVKFRIVQGSCKKLGKFPSKYIVADFYEGLCRCRFSVSPVTGNAVSSMYASRESMVLSMVGHLFQNYDTRHVRFFPTYTCNHSCYTIYVRFFVTYTCVLSCFVGFLFPSIWPFSYKRAYICAQKSPYIFVTNKHAYMGSQKVVV